MGIRDLLSGRTSTLLTASQASLPTTSPYAGATTGSLDRLIVSDLLPEELTKQLPMDRAQAITIPAVSKARNLLVSTVAKFPLRAIRVDAATGAEADVTTEHPWLYRTRGPVGPQERMAWTVDDLIFHGFALWLLDRGAPVEGRRPILNAEWCPTSRWKIANVDGEPTVLVDDLPIAEDRYMLINSPFEGLLTVAARTLRGARDQEAAWTGRARNPVPMTELHVTDETQYDEDEAKAIVDAWASKRTSDNGAIGLTPNWIELRTHGAVSADLMVEGRNAVRTDVGSFLNVRAAMLDGTIGIDSLTYSTKEGERNAFYEFDLPFWTDPIADRMSLDDIVPRGTRIRFDMYHAYNAPAATGPRMED